MKVEEKLFVTRSVDQYKEIMTKTAIEIMITRGVMIITETEIPTLKQEELIRKKPKIEEPPDQLLLIITLLVAAIYLQQLSHHQQP